MPTLTPTRQPENNGDWTYFGPECPGQFENCSPFPDEFRFISLVAYSDTNARGDRAPNIDLQCHKKRPLLFFYTGGPWAGLGDATLSIRFVGQAPEEGKTYQPDRHSNDATSMSFSGRNGRSIVQFIDEAEQQGMDITMEASSDLGMVVGYFDITGFASNFQRLQC